MRTWLITLVCILGLLFLPCRSVQAQDERPQWHKLTDLTNQWRKDAINFEDVEARRRAVDGFAAIGREINEAVAVFSSRLTDQDGEVRVKAAKALYPFGATGRGAAARLCHVLETDPLNEARLHAARALGSIFSDGSNPGYMKPVVPALIKALRHDRDPLVRRQACTSLGGIGHKAHAAAPLFLELMKDKEDDSMRNAARESFDYVVSPSCKMLMPTLLEMYKKGIEDPLIEGTVLIALAKIGEKEEIVLPILVEALKNPKRRGFAAMAIGKMGPKAKTAVPDLVSVLNVSQAGVQYVVLAAIEEIGVDACSAIPALRKFADDPTVDRNVRRTAQRVLKSLEQQ
jgi:HEAT repeat protein